MIGAIAQFAYMILFSYSFFFEGLTGLTITIGAIVTLALLMGAALGKYVAVALMLGMIAALVPGLYLLVRHGQAARKMAIPFAPFLALGSIVALFWGEWILDSYMKLLGA